MKTKKHNPKLKLAGSIKLDPNELKTRDLLLVRLINGATKAGVRRDARKEANRRECRGRWLDKSE